MADHALAGPPQQVAIARAFGAEGNPTSAWADAVSAGGWAAATATPILLTTTDALHPAVQGWLDDRDVTRHVVLGGTAAVADAAVATLEGVERVAGPNRFASAVAIADDLWTSQVDGWLVTSGDHPSGWAHALAAAGLSADRQSPLLLVETSRLPAETDEALACVDGERPPITVVGGPGIVGDAVREGLSACP